MNLSEKIWIKIQESFNFRKIKEKMPKDLKKKPLPEYQVDLNIDQKEVVLWSQQNDEIIKQLKTFGFVPEIINKQYLQQVYKELILDDQNIRQIDKGILVFQNLTCLSLNQNNIQKLENIPEQLLELHLHQNQISNIDKFMKIENLQYLGLGLNQIQDQSLEKISEIFPNLITIDISHNNLNNINQIIDYLKKLQKIKIINLFGNAICLSINYPHFIIKEFKDLKYFDNVAVDHQMNQKFIDEILQENNRILNQNLTIENQQSLKIDIQTLENITGNYFEEQKIFSSYWIQAKFLNDLDINTQNDMIGLDKAEVFNDDKFILDFQQTFTQTLQLNQKSVKSFLKKFMIKIFSREPQVTINQETGERQPILNSENEATFVDKILGITVLDLSSWVLEPQPKQQFQQKLHLYPEETIQKYQLYYPLENESNIANDLYEKEIEKINALLQNQDQNKDKDKGGKKTNKPAKKEDKKGAKAGKEVTQEKVLINQLDYQQSQRMAILIDDETIIRSLGPMLSVSVQILNQ